MSLRRRHKHYDFDAIIFATGFDAMTGAAAPRSTSRGRSGETSPRRAGAPGPRTYLGLSTWWGFRTFFTITGPRQPLRPHRTWSPSIEQHVEWIADCIASPARPRAIAAIEAHARAAQRRLGRPRERWSPISTLYPSCNSWYLGANVPGKPRRLHAVARLRRPTSSAATKWWPTAMRASPSVGRADTPRRSSHGRRRARRLRADHVHLRGQNPNGVPAGHRTGGHRDRGDAGHHPEGARLRQAGGVDRLHGGVAPPVRRARSRSQHPGTRSLGALSYMVSSIVPVCVSREFVVLATGRTSPVVAWLRALAADEHARCGGPGVGAWACASPVATHSRWRPTTGCWRPCSPTVDAHGAIRQASLRHRHRP